jgi:hypothetical protein
MNLREVMTGTSPMDPQSQNLINPSKISTAQRPPGTWRSLGLDVVAVLSAGLFGYCYYRYLTQGWSVWFLFAALTFFAVASVMEVFLSKGGWRSIFVILLEVVATLGFFWRDEVTVLGIIAAIMIVMLVWGHMSAHAQVQNGIEIPFFGASGNILGKFTTAVLLFMILAYVPQIGGNALVVSQQSFRTFFDWTSGLVNSFYPELSLTGSFGDFAQSASKMELQNNPSFQSLNTAQQNIALQQAATQFTQNFLKNASGTIATTSPASDAFYNVLNGVLSAWQNQSSGWFDVGWVTVLFIGLRTLGILFVWFAQFICLIFYELLLASGFMKISEEPHVREVVGY